MARFMIDSVEIDYLRMATFNPDEFLDLQTYVQYSVANFDDYELGKWRNYTGYWYDKKQGFWGTGMQGKKEHCVGQVSGCWAAVLAKSDFRPDTYCTRVDLQLTVESPAKYDAYKLATKLSSAQWKGHKKEPQLIKNFDGSGDTVAMGNRGSQRYIRIYEKFDDKGRRFIRFEVEFKQKLAKAVWEMIASRGNTAGVRASILAGEIERLPLVNDPSFLACHVRLMTLYLRACDQIWQGKKVTQ